jgi:hypothetical protein
MRLGASHRSGDDAIHARLLRVGWKRSRFGLISITEVPVAGQRAAC